MNATNAVELNKKTLANGHVIITYKDGNFIYHNEYLNETDSQNKDPNKIISKSYIQKDKTGGHTHIYVNPQQQDIILKTVSYNSNNQIMLETHFWENKNKKLIRFYSNGLLTQAWEYTEKGEMKQGISYKRNTQNKYEVISVSIPVFNQKNELSHLIVKETNPNGHPTGKIIERTFYLLNKPSIRDCYILNEISGQKEEIILSNENGKWCEVKDRNIQKQLLSIFKKLIQLETSKNSSNVTLEKNSNVTFEDLYYHDVLKFKQTHSDLRVFIPEKEKHNPNQSAVS